MKLTPIYDRIIVSRDKAKDVSEGGIVLPDQAQEQELTGTVLAVGQGRLADDGSIRPMPFVPGQKVLFGKYAGVVITLNKEEFTVIKGEDILAIVED